MSLVHKPNVHKKRAGKAENRSYRNGLFCKSKPTVLIVEVEFRKYYSTIGHGGVCA
jgi:hypothetical protein